MLGVVDARVTELEDRHPCIQLRINPASATAGTPCDVDNVSRAAVEDVGSEEQLIDLIGGRGIEFTELGAPMWATSRAMIASPRSASVAPGLGRCGLDEPWCPARCAATTTRQ